MNMKIILTCLAITRIVQGADIVEKPKKHVIIISPDVIATPKDTKSMLSNLGDAPSLFKHVGFWRLMQMARNGTFIHQRGEEIAQETPGAARVIRKLFGQELKEKYGEFQEPALKALIASSVQPTKRSAAFDLLKKIKQEEANHLIFCVTEHDAEEHQIFRDYLRDYQKQCFSDFIDGVMTLPNYSTTVSSDNASYVRHESYTEKNRWVVVKNFSKDHYQQTLDTLLKEVGAESLPIVTIKEKMPDRTIDWIEGMPKVVSNIMQNDIHSIEQHLRFMKVLTV